MDEDWKAKEDKFHLSQALERAMIRIKDNRAKPIDILALNLMIATKSTFDSVFSSNIQTFLDSYSNVISEPYLITINLSLEQLSELATDILLYKSLEKDTRNSNFWNAMSTIVSHQISLLESNNDSIQSSILQDVEKLTMNKSFKQLCTLESQIQEKLDRGGNIDVEYWQQILKNLNVWKSKARVKEMYNFMLKEKQESSTKSISTAKTKSIQVSPGIFIDIEIGAKSAPIEEYDPTMSPILNRDLHRDDSLMDIEDEEKDYLNILSHRKALLKKIQKRPSGPVVDPHFQAFLTNEGSDISQDQVHSTNLAIPIQRQVPS